MNRSADWEARLRVYMENQRDARFQWGSADCCTFAAGAVEAMTGVDVMSEFRGRYSSEAAASAALKKIGKGSLKSTLNSKFSRVQPAEAHRGDIVMVEGNLGVALGPFSIHLGQEGDREGLIRKPRALWSHAWKVPFGG